VWCPLIDDAKPRGLPEVVGCYLLGNRFALAARIVLGDWCLVAESLVPALAVVKDEVFSDHQLWLVVMPMLLYR